MSNEKAITTKLAECIGEYPRIDWSLYLRLAKKARNTKAYKRLRARTIDEYGPKCMCCGHEPKSISKLHLDHVRPVRFYPELFFEASNVQLLCEQCNSDKGTKTIDYRPVRDETKHSLLEKLNDTKRELSNMENDMRMLFTIAKSVIGDGSALNPQYGNIWEEVRKKLENKR